MVVEGHARRDHIEKGESVEGESRLQQGDQLFLVTTEGARDEGGTQFQRQTAQVDGGFARKRSTLRWAPAIRSGRELSLGQTIDAIVLDDVDHPGVATDDVNELTHPDAGGVAIATDSDGRHRGVGHVGTGGETGHPAVGRVEAHRIAEEIRRRLGTAADATHLEDIPGIDIQIVRRLDHRLRDPVVTATLAHR